MLADAEDLEYGTPGRFTVLRCLDCGLGWQEPRPTLTQALASYPKGYVHHHEKTGLIVRLLLPYSIKQKAVIISRLIGRRGRILDVGCGSGQSLAELRRYGEWELHGVEPTAEAATTASRDYGIQAMAGTLEEAGYEADTFDLVICTHVIEHVPDPLATLVEIRRILKPGGYLVGETENIAALTFRLFRKYWGFLHLPYHLFFFTKPVIAQCMERGGFGEIRVSDIFNHSGWFLSITNWFEKKRGRSGQGRPWYYPALILLTFPLGLFEAGNSSAIAFIGRKTG
jgi:SAM-dependent methyltransferase